MTGTVEISRLRSRIAATLTRAPLPTADPEVQSDFAKYFCVLVTGLLETALTALVLEVAQRRSAPEIARYVERHLDRWTNPNCEKIAQLLGDFSPGWRSSIEGYLVDERKDAVNSLVALRHQIAHGENVGTTLGQVKRYYATVIDVIDFVTKLVR